MKDLILGVHILLARKGRLIDGITVDFDAKPDGDPASNYTKVASCEGWEPRRTSNRIVRRAPVLGRYQDRKTIKTNKQIVYAFDLQEWTSTTFAEMLLGGKEPVGGVFVPDEADEDVQGWFKVQAYDQDDAIILTLDVWGEAYVEPYKFGENLTAYRLILRQLGNDLNVGELDNLDS
jgi:hypothetical protein